MHTRERRPCIETLEPRLFLDGTVTVTLTGALGIVKGDAGANQVTLVQNGTDYTFTPAGGTHIKAGGVDHTAAFTLSAPKLKSLSVDMGGGGDVLSLGASQTSPAFALAGDVSIVLGWGSDVNGLYAYGLACRNLSIDCANGSDIIDLSSVDTAATTLAGNLKVTCWGPGGH